ncbi:iron-sulfur protein [Lentzea sp. NBRC 105346]|uniref:Rieske (2Fe-2S) protein n=1 Tax=Lentzea sp. NBRC 105346 TaxID=3032205 RepID=UPI0024A00C6A|nr:Rieske (2Fe-2S) protein [Lentzea sp. NBRC 105346]GLZ33569.1 iron-sulfur protein [Lentzea sp. NBRC 105346]
MLCGIAVALAVPSGLITTACSSGSTPSPGTGSASGPTSNPDNGSTGSPPTGRGNPSASALIALADVPEGGGAVVDNPNGGKIVIARTSATEVKAFNATCPHQGSIVGEPEGGTITCPSHGSQFGAADGSLKQGPATKGLTSIAVKVQNDQVFLA